MVKYDLPDDYYQTYDDNVRNLTLGDLTKVSKEVVDPEAVNWFMVGDKVKVIDKLKDLGFDAIIDIDADGNQLSHVPKPEKKIID